MAPVIVLFTRDLRVHDHPALVEAVRTARHVVPLFVLDPAILRHPDTAPNRRLFLRQSLADLRQSLRAQGGELVIREGATATVVGRVANEVGARVVHVSDDVSEHSRRRALRLRDELAPAGRELRAFPGVTVVPVGEIATAAGGHYRVFTPFMRAWERHPWRGVLAPPERIRLPAGIEPGALPSEQRLAAGAVSPELVAGGETAARRRLASILGDGLAAYAAGRDDLAADLTSRLSPYLHFGCISPLAVAGAVRDQAGGPEIVRQLAWRDFHHHTALHVPRVRHEDIRSRPWGWRRDADELAAWQEGRTGIPIVDAGMRQLLREGWMHNRARMVVATLLTKHLRHDWREGAAHFARHLVDGDVANNSANWQWVAGTGTDTRPNRIMNPLRQAERFDPLGRYVARHVPELGHLSAPEIHMPWRLPARRRRGLAYPEPIVDLAEAASEFRMLPR